MKYLYLSTALLTATLGVASAQNSTSTSATTTAKKITDHSAYAMSETIWNTSLEEFKTQNAQLQFKWQSAQKSGLRSIVLLPLFGKKTGETLITGKNGKVSRLKFSVFNRGDHGHISASALQKRFDQLKTALDNATSKKHKDISKKGALTITSYLWKTKTSAFLLEKSVSGNRGEFLRLRVAPVREAGSGNKTAGRSSLKKNVQRDSNGDVWIKSIPMVDQGRKGYCACASSARIYQYYGREVSMHEVAQMAGSDSQGTDPVKMISAFKKAAGKLNSRVVVFYEYPKYMTKPQSKMTDSNFKASYREAVSDINKYQQLAKKKKTKLLNIDGKAGGKAKKGQAYSIMNAQRSMDPETYKEVMMKKPSYKRFMSNIKKYINEGVPVGWALQLGMFPEQGLPQAGGGHMRLIIGYNEKKGTIIYSDSWGAGHDKKSMPAGNAFSMTNVLLTMPPSR